MSASGVRVDEEVERAHFESRPVVTSCAHCAATFADPLSDGRAWFADNRAKAHPELPPLDQSRRYRRRRFP